MEKILRTRAVPQAQAAGFARGRLADIDELAPGSRGKTGSLSIETNIPDRAGVLHRKVIKRTIAER